MNFQTHQYVALSSKSVFFFVNLFLKTGLFLLLFFLRTKRNLFSISFRASLISQTFPRSPETRAFSRITCPTKRTNQSAAFSSGSGNKSEGLSAS